MNTTLIPFSEIVENVQDDTGISNLSNVTEKLRRWIVRAEQRLGYNGALVMKKVTYTKSDTNWPGKKLWLPSDAHSWLTVRIDDERINNYRIREYGNFLEFDDSFEDGTTLVLYYYGFMFDSEGSPIVPRGHADAINAYMVWKLFAAKAFLEPTRRSRRVVIDYRQEWYDERDAAQGEDAFFQNDEDYEVFSTIRSMSTKDATIYYPNGDYENDAIQESKTSCVLRTDQKEIKVYAWQYGNRVTDITDGPNIDNSWLNTNATEYELLTLLTGVIVPYNQIGRIAFAVQGSQKEKAYAIYDTFNSDVTDIVFDQYYNSLLDLDIYISKEFYSHSNIFFKLKEL